MNIRYATIAVLLCWAVLGRAAELPPATDLAADVQRSVQDKQPLVVMFSSDGCPYCEAVSHYLAALVDNPAYQGRARVRLVETQDGDTELLDFAGQRRSHAAFADAQGVGFVPIVRFFGPKGERLAPDLVGLGLEDFYLPYLLENVDAARAKLQMLPGRASAGSSAAPPGYGGG